MKLSLKARPMPHIPTRSILAVPAVALPLLAIMLFFAAAPAALAQPGGGIPCTTPDLVNAISAAVTAGGNQAITLSPGCTYTLTAVNNGSDVNTNGLPLITHTVRLSIFGNGATIVRDAGAPRFRLFQVGAGASLALTNITLSGGHTPDGVSASNGNGGYGGAILNSGGTLTVTSSTIRGNFTGAGGSCCSAVDAGKGGAGGGIHNNLGVVNVISSTIAGNSTGDGGSSGGDFGGLGGGLASSGGNIHVTASTISSNSTGSFNPGGTFQGAGVGGGIYVTTGTLSVSDSTIAGNSIGSNVSSLLYSLGFGGGIFLEEAAMTMTNSTIARNMFGDTRIGGGYVAFSSQVIFKNTLIVSNSNNNCVGTAPAAGSTNNMTDDSNSNLCGSSFTQKTVAQINLGPLQNNGGPTLTMALQFPSAAIDAGDDASCPPVDQRGQPRPHAYHCDIGAYEFESFLNTLFLPLARR